jgi:hypothetical protein
VTVNPGTAASEFDRQTEFDRQGLVLLEKPFSKYQSCLEDVKKSILKFAANSAFRKSL